MSSGASICFWATSTVRPSLPGCKCAKDCQDDQKKPWSILSYSSQVFKRVMGARAQTRTCNSKVSKYVSNITWSPPARGGFSPTLRGWSARPFHVQEWFQLMPHLLSSEGWAVALARPKAKLCHRTCPWGGHLIRFNLKGITIQNAPAKTSHVLVRHRWGAGGRLGAATWC